MDPKEAEEVDEQLSGWILNFLNRKLKKGFSVRKLSLALQWAHERFAVEHMYDGWGDVLDGKSQEEEKPQESPEEEDRQEETGEDAGAPEGDGQADEEREESPSGPQGILARGGGAENGQMIEVPRKRRGRPPKKKTEAPSPPRAKGDPDNGFCAKCVKAMKVQSESRSRFTRFVLWKCKCGFEHLERRHDI